MYSKTTNRLGYVTGIKIWLNFGAVRHKYDQYLHKKKDEYRRKKAVTLESHINPKYFNNTIRDEKTDAKLASFAQTLGYEFDPPD